MKHITTAVLLFLLPTSAFAHVGFDDAGGFVHGFLHPFGGIDHVLVMLSVGLLAALLGGRALWLVPLAFISAMAFAGVMGAAGLRVPYAEVGIALSVAFLGLTIALGLRVSVFTAMALVGGFALFHGYAHGAQMPDGVSGHAYGIGFMCATAILHALGIGLGLAIGTVARSHRRRIEQLGGGAIAVAGVTLLSALV
jgi:urease accessory protein